MSSEVPRALRRPHRLAASHREPDRAAAWRLLTYPLITPVSVTPLMICSWKTM